MPVLESFKPLLTALVLPPVPWLLLALLGALLASKRRRLGALLLGLGLVLIWLSACQGSGQWLQQALLTVPPPLGESELSGLRQERNAAAKPATAIVVLGGGRVLHAPESGTSDLGTPSLQRLRYGIRLARETGLPLAFSGGAGWAARVESGASEAEIARRIALRDFRHPITWIEAESRDTQENAQRSVPLLQAAGIRHIVLVTHALHMPRALHEFGQAAAGALRVTAAPMGYFSAADRGVLDWMPSADGFEQVRLVLRERLGLVVASVRPN
ncbi:MAG: YdcF family protein [Methylibium sp.]|uniref:YdcF family protein n=1 Tax=Methylibium sp. TaxID=2067992 RepID=UPI0017AE259C|nr:YdcF family protein [Methylibium sp.]MBA3597814.1 YdcF family protein [Methylibium sp.]